MDSIDISAFVRDIKLPAEADDGVLPVTRRHEVRFTGSWNPDVEPDEWQTLFTFIGPINNYAGIIFEGPAIGPHGVTNVVIAFPTRDRRKARRVSRLTGRRFRKTADGTYAFQ